MSPVLAQPRKNIPLCLCTQTEWWDRIRTLIESIYSTDRIYCFIESIYSINNAFTLLRIIILCLRRAQLDDSHSHHIFSNTELIANSNPSLQTSWVWLSLIFPLKKPFSLWYLCVEGSGTQLQEFRSFAAILNHSTWHQGPILHTSACFTVPKLPLYQVQLVWESEVPGDFHWPSASSTPKFSHSYYCPPLVAVEVLQIQKN